MIDLIEYMDKKGISYEKSDNGNNLVVGGDIDLRNTDIKVLPDNLVVGGNLDLEGTDIKVLPDNLVVGGCLYLEGTDIKQNPKVTQNTNIIFSWQGGKYRKIDGIFCEVIPTKSKKYIKAKLVNSDKIFFIIERNGVFSHGDTVKDAINSLKYKISNRDTSQYNDHTLESVLTQHEAITMYRVITGACETGVKMFVENLDSVPMKMTVNELIEFTKNQYGNHLLRDFINK